ncbi:MAG TPA: cytochrome c3 family protein [Coriobacteriia bacterium]
MAKISLAGFRDPVRRPRYIVWTFTIVFALAAFMVVALGATSTFWFCAEVCHKVQDDTIEAYKASVHSQISCMACHEPVGADTVTFLLAKIKSAGEVIPTVGNTFSLPLNAGSALALTGGHEMGSQQCTQCHTATRKTTPPAGLIINHKVHADAGIWCTVCHNRVAHNDTVAQPKLVAPNGTKNTVHPNFMKMDACFRCHDLGGAVKMTGAGAKTAPGTCATCHTSDFTLTPASHTAADWKLLGHGSAAKEADTEYRTALTEKQALVDEGIAAYLGAPVSPCYTCHEQAKFCDTCHGGVQMPHPTGFLKSHKTAAATDTQACQKCHLAGGEKANGKAGTLQFCQDCHHKGGPPNVSWLVGHPKAVDASGTAGCFKCHSPVYCATCHIRYNK